jgi:tetratricopeptide (TPR) repeat protein
MPARLMPWLLLAALWTAAFALACRLATPGAYAVSAADAGVAEQLLGESRLLAGDLCFEEADLYLHRGMPHVKAEAFTNRWLQRLAAAVSPRVLQHRESATELRDVLPWVNLAARFAPTNADFTLTQSYLLERTGNTAGALGALRRGRAALPRDPALPFEEARLLLSLERWSEAATLLDLAKRLNAARPPGGDGDDMLAEIDLWRALLLERDGQAGAAAQTLEQAIALRPAWYGGLTNRVAALRAGRAPEPPIAQLLDAYRRIARVNPLCHDDDGD